MHIASMCIFHSHTITAVLPRWMEKGKVSVLENKCQQILKQGTSYVLQSNRSSCPLNHTQYVVEKVLQTATHAATWLFLPFV